MPDDVCPIDEFLRRVGGRWKAPILWHLMAGPRRFNDLKRQVPLATQKVFTQQLRDLQREGLVSRRVLHGPPLRVEYGLTTLGRSVEAVLIAMHAWGDEHCVRAGRAAPPRQVRRGRRGSRRRTPAKQPAGGSGPGVLRKRTP